MRNEFMCCLHHLTVMQNIFEDWSEDDLWGSGMKAPQHAGVYINIFLSLWSRSSFFPPHISSLRSFPVSIGGLVSTHQSSMMRYALISCLLNYCNVFSCYFLLQTSFVALESIDRFVNILLYSAGFIAENWWTAVFGCISFHFRGWVVSVFWFVTFIYLFFFLGLDSPWCNYCF